MEAETNRPSPIPVQSRCKWTSDPFSPPVKWITDPDKAILEKLARRELKVSDDTLVQIEFLGEGVFNKAYTIHYGDKSDMVVRVSAPVLPGFKTLSEQATISYVRQCTDYPIPKTLAYDASSENELGFEWTIMERVPGAEMDMMKWITMTWMQKELLVRKIVPYTVQMFQTRFKHIGNLYHPDGLHRLNTKQDLDIKTVSGPNGINDQEYCLSNIVSSNFFRNDRLKQVVPRGPFDNSHDWIKALLDLEWTETQETLTRTFEYEDDLEYFQDRAAIIERLLKLLPKIFIKDEDEEFTLFHSDLSFSNVMISENNELAGIIDWECTQTAPLWMACDTPKFLENSDQTDYPRDEELQQDFDLDDDQIDLDALMAYEQYQLRQFFYAEMNRLCPEWVQEHEKGVKKRDFVLAIMFIESHRRYIQRWLDQIESGPNCVSLRDDMFQDPSF